MCIKVEQYKTAKPKGTFKESNLKDLSIDNKPEETQLPNIISLTELFTIIL